MKLNIDDQVVELPCPQCGHKLPEKIGRLKHNPQLTCVCGAVIDVDAADLATGIKTVEKELDDFSRSISGMFK